MEVGKAFWKDMLSKPMVLLPPAAPDEPPRLPAGRRLLYHRLCCRVRGTAHSTTVLVEDRRLPSSGCCRTPRSLGCSSGGTPVRGRMPHCSGRTSKKKTKNVVSVRWPPPTVLLCMRCALYGAEQRFFRVAVKGRTTRYCSGTRQQQAPLLALPSTSPRVQYPGCMLCRPTCDLFMPSPPPQQQTGWLVGTAGGYGTHTNYPNHLSQYRPGVLGGEHDVELPAESENMDAIVQVGY